MDTKYDVIEAFQRNALAWSTPRLIPELALYADLAEQLLTAVAAFPEDRIPDPPSKVAILILISRIFNDFEAAKRLALVGLAEQMYMPLRDIIESAGLLVLFVVEPKKARRWVTNLSEYHSQDVRDALASHDVRLALYEQYGALSHLSHPNVLGSLTRVRERPGDTRAGIMAEYHYGGYQNEPWLKMEMRLLLVFMLLAVREAVAPVIVHFGEDLPEEWWKRYQALVERLNDLGIEINEIPKASVRFPRDRHMSELVRTRLRVSLPAFNLGEINGPEMADPST